MSVPSKQFTLYSYKEHKEFAVKQAKYFDALTITLQHLACFLTIDYISNYYHSLFNY